MERILELTKPLCLYERLGKVEGIALIVDDVVEAHMNNPKIKDIFTPYKEQPEELSRVRQQTIDLISSGSGGPNQFKSNDRPTSYLGVQLTPQQFIFVIDDILNVLEEHSVNETSKKDMLAILWSLKGTVINQN